MDKPEPREVFDLIFEAVPRSATMRRIRQEVYGPDFPAELDAFSYVTAEQLRRFATELGVGPGDTFADLGCGCGGPGLWVARETGASIAGIDFSSAAIAQAESSAASFGVAERARYARADIASTGLPPGSVDAAMSVDVVQITPSRAAVFTEVARILRPGARFIFTKLGSGWFCAARGGAGTRPRTGLRQPADARSGWVRHRVVGRGSRLARTA